MAMLDRWRAIAVRIEGIRTAADLAGRLAGPGNVDKSTLKILGDDCITIRNAIIEWSERFADQLPQTVRTRVGSFKHKYSAAIDNAPSDFGSAKVALIALVAMGTEITYHLSDEQVPIRSRAERSFMHLQRLIVANAADRQTWKTAFASGEVPCERLGGAHLLWHGIFAFKVDGERDSTHLVFAEPIDQDDFSRSGAPLVLTEWKKAIGEADAQKRFEEAFEQAKIYENGALAGLALRSHRYLVVVTEKRLRKLPEDRVDDDVTYRHVNIAVDREIPSREAKRIASGTGQAGGGA